MVDNKELVILGFWPGLADPKSINLSPTRLHEGQDAVEITTKLCSSQELDVVGVAWGVKDERVVAGLVVQEAKLLRDYMRWYSENRPARWFSISMRVNKDGYEFEVEPNVSLSAQRQARIHKVDAKKVKVLYRRVHVQCPKPRTLEIIKPYLFTAKSIDLVLIDRDTYCIPDPNNPGGWSLTSPKEAEIALADESHKISGLKFTYSDN